MRSLSVIVRGPRFDVVADIAPSPSGVGPAADTSPSARIMAALRLLTLCWCRNVYMRFLALLHSRRLTGRFYYRLLKSPDIRPSSRHFDTSLIVKSLLLTRAGIRNFGNAGRPIPHCLTICEIDTFLKHNEFFSKSSSPQCWIGPCLNIHVIKSPSLAMWLRSSSFTNVFVRS